MLRTGGGLDNGRRIRRGPLDEWKHIYKEESLELENYTEYSQTRTGMANASRKPPYTMSGQPWSGDKGLKKKWGVKFQPPLLLPAMPMPRPYSTLPSLCDKDYPRIFHMFWTGPFTDKPYMAILSFLYTQNVGLHLREQPGLGESPACRPQFWFWVNPGPAAAFSSSASSNMYDELKSNSWSAPFLHERFKDVIYFKLWNLTEQLDNVSELKEEWRSFSVLFNSGGHKFQVPATAPVGDDEGSNKTSKKNDIYNRVGSKSADSVDKLSTVMSDMVRFILCHRFGGVYLDADNLLLRDWEELWGWKGAFAYRWSRLPDYNTAILRLHKHSALGTFLLRTALKNGLDFHPMKITRYLNDAHLNNLLFRIPDALFDPARLSIEMKAQREQAPQPNFRS